MSRRTPTFEEINMSAEIGAYQGDQDGNTPPAPRAQDDESSTEDPR